MQLLRHAPRTVVHLVLCNRTADDVLFGSRLEPLQRLCPSFYITHVLEEGSLPEPSNSRQVYQSGRIKASTLQAVAHHTPALLSGPPGLVESSYYTLLRLGWLEEEVQCLDGLPPGSKDPRQTLDEIENNSNASTGSTQSLLSTLWGMATCRRRRRSKQEL